MREDPERKGLLFAGTERQVWVSFDDGDHWQSLRLNLPATSIRDLVIHDDDLVVGTHGRSFWILDDITPLRQLDARAAEAPAHLFRPQLARRVRWNMNDRHAAAARGARRARTRRTARSSTITQAAAAGPVTLEILDAAGKLVRRYSSADKPEPVDEKDSERPDLLGAPAACRCPPRAGMHRFVWDLHYPPPRRSRGHEYPMTAIIHDTPRHPAGAVGPAGAIHGQAHGRQRRPRRSR